MSPAENKIKSLPEAVAQMIRPGHSVALSCALEGGGPGGAGGASKLGSDSTPPLHTALLYFIDLEPGRSVFAVPPRINSH